MRGSVRSHTPASVSKKTSVAGRLRSASNSLRRLVLLHWQAGAQLYEFVDGTLLTYKDGVTHHFTAAMTTALTAARNRERLLPAKPRGVGPAIEDRQAWKTVADAAKLVASKLMSPDAHRSPMPVLVSTVGLAIG